ncbi:(2Fe-2S)-binding protein [Acuticoccus sp. MNP-M23]|uniref:(2Fe-2S)-binding protein n=1 Tax=Acuticoccus sp. MNP-M23 TaxID=3072793 RepID=UPI002814B8C3|nr:2Fe-2S iron-sulfur cluster-binding protein [Acuticoccus sp. MNP-M23]WMS40878.1 (2Fe-2S)-binding protein [Acuticoccus sp. MNP-M23]
MRNIQMTLDVNGAEHTIVVEPRTALVDALRDNLGLKGTPAGCEGDCTGACTVLVDNEPIRGCLMFAVQAHGTSVATVEGLSDGVTLNALQEAFVEAGAVQCGYCTPGFLMLASGALARTPDMDDAAIAALVAENMCRCGAYDRIETAIRTARNALKVHAL